MAEKGRGRMSGDEQLNKMTWKMEVRNGDPDLLVLMTVEEVEFHRKL